MSETEVPPSDEAQDTAPESLPLDAWHRAHGGRMVPFAGYEMPIQYLSLIHISEPTRPY